MRLILVRHGQTLWNHEKRAQGVSDIALSDIGLEQVERLALSLKHERIDAIASSPLKRALQTAEAINRFHNLPIGLEEGLKELDMGDFEGIALGDMLLTEGDFLRQWAEDPSSLTMPGGESLTELQDRAWRTVERIMANPGTTLVAAHNFTIMTLLCRIRGMELSHIRKFHVDEASKTFIEFENGSGNIILFNDTAL